MVITQQQIRRALIGIATPPTQELDAYVASLNMWSEVFEITSTKRMAMYLAQTIFESNYLKATSENLNYSAEGLLKVFPKYFNKEQAQAYARHPEMIANRVYANRMGNGCEASGDGWRYRGRGYIMLTGRFSYSRFNNYDLCSEDVITNPDKVSQYPLNQIASLWFWEEHDLNDVADTEDVYKATKIINGGTNGLSQRQLLYRRFAKEFGIKKI